MIFGPLEIVICLGVFMVVALAAASALAGQNILLWWKSSGPRCPKCLTPVNPEAYICRSCKAELERANAKPKELP